MGPGTAFGLAPHFRISYATSNEELRDAALVERPRAIGSKR